VSPARSRQRSARLFAALTGLLALLCCGGVVAVITFSGLTSDEDSFLFSSFGCGREGPIDVNGKLPLVAPYRAAQMRNAAIIINVGAEKEVPPRGWVIAVATAMQESGLANLPHLGDRNDHDSIGLFQQRPSQGWGTPEQLLDPAYTAGKFYDKLVKVPNWEQLPLTVAAQAVQISAFPDAYAKHEPIATRIVNVLTGGAARAGGGSTDLRCTIAGEISAAGWTAPVPGSVGSGFRTADRPGHNGVDIAAAKGTPIHAAAAGRVLVSRCDPDQYGQLTCDVDGSPSKSGCGWFVDIQHAADVITRYCHMLRKPLVEENELVQAGQKIGEVGSSGNSSGPHLHFEVHLGGDRSGRSAVDPAGFMQERGAPLVDAG
jgi:murein DD-endopeptidase MepM/ murein hydrolase activator NlpD